MMVGRCGCHETSMISISHQPINQTIEWLSSVSLPRTMSSCPSNFAAILPVTAYMNSNITRKHIMQCTATVALKSYTYMEYVACAIERTRIHVLMIGWWRWKATTMIGYDQWYQVINIRQPTVQNVEGRMDGCEQMFTESMCVRPNDRDMSLMNDPI